MAMTRSEICIEQSNFTKQADDQYGMNIWLPLGANDDEWILHVLSPHNSANDGVTCLEHGMTYVGKCVPGEYIFPLVAEPELTFPGIGNWSQGVFSTTYPEGWRRLYTSSSADASPRNMRLAVPAGTTRLYMLPFGRTTFGTMNITKISGDGTIIESSVDLNTATAAIDMDTTTVPGNMGGPKYDGLVLIASDCGGAVLDFVGDGTPGNYDLVGICGFVCVKDGGDATEANPYDGVFDPATMTEVMVYESGNTHQVADGPLHLNISGDQWWGLGHWKSDGSTLINESEELYYQDSTTDAWIDWATVNTVDTHIRKKAWGFGRTLKGDIQVDMSGTDYTVGTYISIYSFNSIGLTITLDHLFNAAAAAQGLEFNGRGGYGGQWSIAKSFAKFIMGVPVLDYADKYKIRDSFVDNSIVYDQNSSLVLLFGGPSKYEVLVQGEGTILSGGGSVLKTTPRVYGIERGNGAGEDVFMKIYFNNKYDSSTLAIADGDRSFSRHSRIVTRRNALGTVRSARTGTANYGRLSIIR